MMSIQWFPGHMTKAKRQMIENIQKVDMVIEIRDCRIPLSSTNPMLDDMIKTKPRLILLSKKDKGQVEEIKKWIEVLNNENTQAIAMDLLKDPVLNKTVEACQKVMQPMIDRQIRRGIKPRAIRAMVVGIPNVGKSTFINQIAKKKATKTSDRPGVTKDLQWVKCNEKLELLDTPGVLWPRFEDRQVALHLAITGAIRDKILPLEDIVVYAIETLSTEVPEYITKRYDIEIQEDAYKTIEAIARNKNWIKTGNEIDYDRAYNMILNEIRDDKLGNFTWEKVHD